MTPYETSAAKMLDLCAKDEILRLLNLADQLKYEQKHGIAHIPLWRARLWA